MQLLAILLMGFIYDRLTLYFTSLEEEERRRQEEEAAQEEEEEEGGGEEDGEVDTIFDTMSPQKKGNSSRS